MKDNSSIFRPAAVRRYLDKRERTVFPVYAAPRTTLCSVLLAVILAAGVLLAAVASVPTYAKGAAVLVGREEGGARSPAEAEAVIFVSPEVLSELKVGQRVFLRDGAGRWRFAGQIKALAPGVASPTDARALFNLGALPDGVLKDRAAVALASPPPPRQTSREKGGGVLEARVEIGERRLLSFGR